ncbi:MAG: hypothetical protein ABW292_16600 [Vicinamibacterales bacterium]
MRRRADAERERQDGGQGEGRLTKEAADRASEVLNEVVHGRFDHWPAQRVDLARAANDRSRGLAPITSR